MSYCYLYYHIKKGIIMTYFPSLCYFSKYCIGNKCEIKNVQIAMSHCRYNLYVFLLFCQNVEICDMLHVSFLSLDQVCITLIISRRCLVNIYFCRKQAGAKENFIRNFRKIKVAMKLTFLLKISEFYIKGI